MLSAGWPRTPRQVQIGNSAGGVEFNNTDFLWLAVPRLGIWSCMSGGVELQHGLQHADKEAAPYLHIVPPMNTGWIIVPTDLGSYFV
ncbi:hypothetical protein NHJ13734_004962 [Beauveria thailandica]